LAGEPVPVIFAHRCLLAAFVTARVGAETVALANRDIRDHTAVVSENLGSRGRVEIAHPDRLADGLPAATDLRVDAWKHQGAEPIIGAASAARARKQKPPTRTPGTDPKAAVYTAVSARHVNKSKPS